MDQRLRDEAAGAHAAAAQAGAKEGSPDQRILFTISDDKQQFDAERGWVETAPEPVSRGLSQWEPTLFLAPNRTLWLFFSQGVPPQDGSFDGRSQMSCRTTSL